MLLGACAGPGGRVQAPSIEIASGEVSAGGTVAIAFAGFPPEREVIVGGGLANSEFQTSALARSDAAGRGRAALRLPPTARQGTPWVFVAMTRNHDLRARTGPVPIARAGVGQQDAASSEGVVTVEGVVSGVGVECVAVRGDDGELYTLAGSGRRLAPGQRVRVAGEIAAMSFCMQGTTLQVHSITVL